MGSGVSHFNECFITWGEGAKSQDSVDVLEPQLLEEKGEPKRN